MDAVDRVMVEEEEGGEDGGTEICDCTRRVVVIQFIWNREVLVVIMGKALLVQNIIIRLGSRFARSCAEFLRMQPAHLRTSYT